MKAILRDPPKKRTCEYWLSWMRIHAIERAGSLHTGRVAFLTFIDSSYEPSGQGIGTRSYVRGIATYRYARSEKLFLSSPKPSKTSLCAQRPTRLRSGHSQTPGPLRASSPLRSRPGRCTINRFTSLTCRGAIWMAIGDSEAGARPFFL